jgi:translation elongation factor EF-G
LAVIETLGAFSIHMSKGEFDMAEKRQLTIKAAMTRCKTIQGQLHHITQKVQQYAVINDKTKHLLGDTKLPNSPEGLRQNHDQARKEMESLFQQFNDLTTEYTKLKCAIDKANATTTIEVGGRTMTLREALTLKANQKDGVVVFYKQLLQAYAASVRQAQIDVQNYNKQFANASDEAKAVLLADVESMIDAKKIEELNQFVIDFVNEVDGALDTANISTIIEIE